MTENDLFAPGESLFTTDGKDVWELESYYIAPSCTLRNLRTGEKQNFGIGGLTAETFKRIIMPKVA